MKNRFLWPVSVYIALAILLIAISIALIYYALHRQQDSPVIDLPAEESALEAPEQNAVPVIMDRFIDLHEQNNDFVGWLRVPNTSIDYPVVYCEDNSFYLTHDFYKKPLSIGTPFLDMGADLLEKNQSLSIYGHYKRIFTELHNYKEIDYYKANPTFEFDSLYEEGTYKIFSIFYMAGNHTDKYFYYYPASHFSDDEGFMNHVNQLVTRSIFVTPVDVTPDDQLVLLTCCTYETDNLRLIIAGRKTRPGESGYVDTVRAYLNPEPLYPKKWYDKKGGAPPPLP